MQIIPSFIHQDDETRDDESVYLMGDFIWAKQCDIESYKEIFEQLTFLKLNKLFNFWRLRH